MSENVSHPAHPLTDQVRADTLEWVDKAVIGLNLCPFAKGSVGKGRLQVTVSAAQTEEEALQAVHDELVALASCALEERETTLLVFPAMFDDFLYFNDFAGAAEEILADLELEGVLQIATFHPRYQFDGTEEDDIGNATNQAPYPTLHLLREDSIDRAVDTYPDVEGIPDRNMALLEEMGHEGWEKLGITAHVTPEEWVSRCPVHGHTQE